MDPELIAYLDERFRETSRQIDERFRETSRQIDQRFEKVDQRFEKVEEGIRHTQVLVEGVQSNVQLLAEGIMGMNERLDLFKLQVGREFEDVRSTIRTLPYVELDHRIRRLEEWREVKDGDPIEILRERFGLRRS